MLLSVVYSQTCSVQAGSCQPAQKLCYWKSVMGKQNAPLHGMPLNMNVGKLLNAEPKLKFDMHLLLLRHSRSAIT